MDMDAMGAFARAEDVQLNRSLYTMIELEGQRYGGFFRKLDARGAGAVPRAAAVEFFSKSTLSDAQVAELYARIKGVGLLPDPERMNAAEFTMAMHLIMCITKRNLVKIPPVFPTYLFPTLDLTSATARGADDDGWSAASAVSTPSASTFSAVPTPSPSPSPSPSAPSALHPGVVAGFAAMNMSGGSDNYHDTPKLRMEDLSTSSSSLSAALSASKLTETRSLAEFVHAEVRHRKAEEAVLSRLEHAEMRTLQRLHSCLDQIASQVDSLGFPVPSASRTLDALDDLNNLFAKHVQAVKQEIQSMEISAQMMDVASERTESMRGVQLKTDPLQQVAVLTDELANLQQQVQSLFARRDALSAQVEVAEAASRSPSVSAPVVASVVPTAVGLADGPIFTPTPTPTPTPSLDAYSTLAQSGGSSSTDVFSVTSSVTNVAGELKTDDPWAAITAPSPPVLDDSTTKPDESGSQSTSLLSPGAAPAVASSTPSFAGSNGTVTPTPTPSLDAYSTLAQSGGSSSTDVFSVSSSAANAANDSKTDDPWAAISAPTPPDFDEATAKPGGSTGLSASLPSPEPPSAFGDEWGTFSAPPSQSENVLQPTTTAADETAKPPAPAAAFDDWGTFDAATSQPENVPTTSVPANKDETATKSTAAPAFGDDWGTFSASTSQQESALATPEPVSDDAKLSTSLTPPVASNALGDDWGAFGSATSQGESASASASASADPFGFGSPVAAASLPSAGASDAIGSAGQAPAASKDEFGWGDFQ